jgi:hypothetical protein
MILYLKAFAIRSQEDLCTGGCLVSRHTSFAMGASSSNLTPEVASRVSIVHIDLTPLCHVMIYSSLDHLRAHLWSFTLES